MIRLLRWLGFTCRHNRTSWPLRRDGQDRVSCLDCGLEMPSRIQFDGKPPRRLIEGK